MGPQLTHGELSSVAGYMSVACWIIVYSPQIWENYQLKSGEGLSVPFIFLWMGGDITNLVGGILTHALPAPLIVLAVYYTVCDVILLYQVYHYRTLARQRAEAASERAPLLDNPEPPRKVEPILPVWLSYPLMLLFVFGAGYAAFKLSDDKPDVDVPTKIEWRSQLLGYTSAVLYMSSRVPQIAHNYKTRCEGLSLAMFFFAMAGNITYIASVLFKSTEHDYIIAMISWILGAAFTIALDVIVLGQFAYFSWADGKNESKVFADDTAASDSDEA